MIPRLLRISTVLMLLVPAFVGAEVAEDVFWDDSFVAHQPDQFADVIVAHDGYLYVGGNFQNVGDITVNYIARFDGTRWEALDTGVGLPRMGLVHTIAIGGDMLYAGGMFDQVGIWATNNIARYDMVAGKWHALGSGMNRAVRRIRIADNGDVYAVGEFSEADGQSANAVARFDGNRWYGLGSGLQMQEGRGGGGVRAGRAMALATKGSGAYVGGMFETANGVQCSNVAWWDGAAFHPLGSGTNGLITVMAVHQGQLYIGGHFSTAGGITANSIARWDGARWWGLGLGIGGAVLNVRKILGVDDRIYVGGEFAVAGSQWVNNLAIWDGTQWISGMGSGTNDEVKEITKWGDAIYVGGNFTSAGGKALAYMTRWAKDVVEVSGFAATPGPSGVRIEWSVDAWAPVTAYRLFRQRESGSSPSARKDSQGRLGQRVDGPMELLVEYGDQSTSAYMDNTARPGVEYTYQLVILRGDGRLVYSPASTVKTVVPALSLEQNHPNPFNPTTTISYSLAETAPVLLTIHNVSGRLIRTLVDETIAAGERAAEWDGRDNRGTFAGTGIYFYRLETRGEVLTRKMALVK